MHQLLDICLQKKYEFSLSVRSDDGHLKTIMSQVAVSRGMDPTKWHTSNRLVLAMSNINNPPNMIAGRNFYICRGDERHKLEMTYEEVIEKLDELLKPIS